MKKKNQKSFKSGHMLLPALGDGEEWGKKHNFLLILWSLALQVKEEKMEDDMIQLKRHLISSLENMPEMWVKTEQLR